MVLFKLVDRASYLMLSLCWQYGVILDLKSHQKNCDMLIRLQFPGVAQMLTMTRQHIILSSQRARGTY